MAFLKGQLDSIWEFLMRLNAHGCSLAGTKTNCGDGQSRKGMTEGWQCVRSDGSGKAMCEEIVRDQKRSGDPEKVQGGIS